MLDGTSWPSYPQSIQGIFGSLALAIGKSIIGSHSLEEFVSKLKKPRRMMLLVQAGKAVDDFIEKLLPFVEPGDIIIDGG